MDANPSCTLVETLSGLDPGGGIGQVTGDQMSECRNRHITALAVRSELTLALRLEIWQCCAGGAALATEAGGLAPPVMWLGLMARASGCQAVAW
jgi:hypothetical protein